MRLCCLPIPPHPHVTYLHLTSPGVNTYLNSIMRILPSLGLIGLLLFSTPVRSETDEDRPEFGPLIGTELFRDDDQSGFGPLSSAGLFQTDSPLFGNGPLLGMGPLIGSGPLIGQGPLQGNTPIIENMMPVVSFQPIMIDFVPPMMVLLEIPEYTPQVIPMVFPVQYIPPPTIPDYLEPPEYTPPPPIIPPFGCITGCGGPPPPPPVNTPCQSYTSGCT